MGGQWVFVELENGNDVLCFRRMFLTNEFRDMEDVWFTTAPNLTVNTVEVFYVKKHCSIVSPVKSYLSSSQMLMDQCPMLQSVGQLSGWSLTPDDVALLRGILESSNSSLVSLFSTVRRKNMRSYMMSFTCSIHTDIHGTISGFDAIVE